MVKLLATVLAPPSKGGTLAERKVRATQLPTGVPPKGPDTIRALVTLPLGAKVTCTLPVPKGPAGALHPEALAAADAKADLAADTLNGVPGFSFGAGAGAGEGLAALGCAAGAGSGLGRGLAAATLF